MNIPLTSGRDPNPANAKFNFSNYLAHRTQPPAPLLNARPRWGHTSFRGAVFSRPDHISELQLNNESYDLSKATATPNQQTLATEQRARVQRVRTKPTSTHSSKTTEVEIKKKHSIHSMDHPKVATPKHGVDVTPAAANFHFTNYLSQRTSPKKNNDKPNWGHTSFRGKVFSRRLKSSFYVFNLFWHPVYVYKYSLFFIFLFLITFLFCFQFYLLLHEQIQIIQVKFFFTAIHMQENCILKQHNVNKTEQEELILKHIQEKLNTK